MKKILSTIHTLKFYMFILLNYLVNQIYSKVLKKNKGFYNNKKIKMFGTNNFIGKMKLKS